MRILITVFFSLLLATRGYGYDLIIPEVAHGDESPVIRLEQVNRFTHALTYIGIPFKSMMFDPGKTSGRVSNPYDASVRGNIEGEKATVYCKGLAETETEAALTFSGGRLKCFSRKSSDEQRKRDLRFILGDDKWSQVSLRRLWFRKKQRKTDGDYWGKGNVRMRLWFANPNGAGVLWAEVGTLFLAGLLFLRSRKWKIGCGIVLLMACVLLWMTESRGSFLAFCVGATLLIFSYLARYFSLKRMCVTVGIVVLVGGLIATGALGERFGKNLFAPGSDRQQRICTWSTAPALIAAAPDGWGVGASGHAYCDWFQ